MKPTNKLPVDFQPRYWGLFKYEWKRDKKNKERELHKVTYSPKTLRTFKWKEEGGHWEDNKHLFGTFEEVVKAYGEHPDQFDGYGYVLEPDVPMPGTEDLFLIVTDLDECRNHEDGRVKPWAMEIMEAQDTFAEISPSGTGVHLIGIGRKKPGCRMVFTLDDHKIENYGGNVGKRRFMTYTGLALEGYERSIGHEAVQRWVDENVPVKERGHKGPAFDYEVPTPESFDGTKAEIVRTCESIKHEDRGDLFKRLYYKGDISSYPSRSEAEISLLNLLAWAAKHRFENDDEMKLAIRGIFEASAFYGKHHRDQWNREGYLDEQIDIAVEGCTSGYTGKPKEQILKRLEAFRIDYDWAGASKDSPNARAAYGAHLALAYDHGWYVRAGEVVPGPTRKWYPIPEAGVLVHSSARDISLFSGVLPTLVKKENGEKDRDYRNITKLNDRLIELGLIKRIYRGVSWGTASLYLLPKSVVDCHEFSPFFSSKTHNQEPQSPPSPQTIDTLLEQERCGSGLCVLGEKLHLTQTLNWIQDKSLTPKQRFLIEQIAWGRKTFEELEEFFSGCPKYLKYSVINPLIDQGLLLVSDEGYRANVEAIDRKFVESGGEKLLNRRIEAVKSERTHHGLRLNELGEEYDPGALHDDDRKAESEKRIEAALRGDLPFRELSIREGIQFLPRFQEQRLKTASR